MIFLFASCTVLADPVKDKCAEVITSLVYKDFSTFRLETQMDGKLKANCSKTIFDGDCRINFDTNAKSWNVGRTYSFNGQVVENLKDQFSVGIENGRYASYQGYRTGDPKKSNPNLGFRASLDADCNLSQHYVIESDKGSEKIAMFYDRKVCEQAANIFVVKKVELESLRTQDNPTRKSIEDFMDQQAKVLTQKMGKPVHFENLTAYDFILNCSSQKATESFYDGRVAKSLFRTKEWIGEVYSNMTSGSSGGSKSSKSKPVGSGQ